MSAAKSLRSFGKEEQEMSRIGREPITVPAGVEITVEENNRITVKGPKGATTRASCTSSVPMTARRIALSTVSPEA